MLRYTPIMHYLLGFWLQPCEVGTHLIVSFIVQMKKLRLRVFKGLLQSRRALDLIDYGGRGI